jgi:hypothetical protein
VCMSCACTVGALWVLWCVLVSVVAPSHLCEFLPGY